MAVTPGTVWIGGRAYPLSNLSARGFLATSYAGDHIEGEWVDIRLAVRLADAEIDMCGKARVVWIDRHQREIGTALFRMDTRFYKAIGAAQSRAVQEAAATSQSDRDLVH